MIELNKLSTLFYNKIDENEQLKAEIAEMNRKNDDLATALLTQNMEVIKWK